MNRISALTITLSLAVTAALAMLTADIISHRIAHLLPRGKSSSTASMAPATAEDLASFAPIIEKGLFGKAAFGKLTPLINDSANSGTAATPVTDLVLLGTVLGSYRETFALVQKTSSKEERVYRLGEKVFDTGTLLTVKNDRIELDLGGKRTPVFMPTAPASSSSSNPPSVPGSGVTQTGSGSFVIDQKALNATLDNIGQAMTDARLLPSMKDGKVEGFRVSEVKPAGVFGMVGLKNGDVLLRINDFAIDSPEKAIQSLAALKGQTRLKVDLIRDNRPTTNNYDIR